MPLLGIHTMEARTERDTCTSVFTVALVTTTKTRKQPRCPLADKWIRKLWYIYTMEYYSAIKHAFEPVLMRWMKVESITESEVSQKEKHQYSIWTHIYGIYYFFPFIFISWSLITLQYCSGFCHTLTCISHGFTCVPHPDLLSHLPLHPIPLGLPSAPALSTCLMHPTWAGDLFHPW